MFDMKNGYNKIENKNSIKFHVNHVFEKRVRQLNKFQFVITKYNFT